MTTTPNNFLHTSAMTPAVSLGAIMAGFANDPLGFVLWAFPWGEPGTVLEDEYPDRWQIAVLEDIRKGLELNEALPADQRIPIQIAVASGHGIGKTALMAWINLWFISTNKDPRIVVTANTFNQLNGKTWSELHKWHNLMTHKHLFTWTATRYYCNENPAEWKADATPWSKHTSEGFAGTHAPAVLYLFDEASAIIDKIWEVSEGAMTTERCIWIVFGNPTRNSGRFRACFGKFRHRWITRSIDARTARKTNKAKIQQWIEDYGIDSDFVRVRVLGKFPRQASNQLISEEQVEFCMTEYEALGFELYPISICCDVARFGDDLSTVGVWQGRKGHELTAYAGKTTVETATLVAEAYRWYKQKYPRIRIHCFVDDIGVGGGVTDILKSWGIPTTGVNSGARADDPEKYLNKRAEMWWRGREAINGGYDLRSMHQENRLKEDLCNIEYFLTAGAQKVQLEAVKDLKERDLPSPDYGTNFVLQFAYPQPLDIINTSAPAPAKRGGSETMAKRRGQGYGSNKEVRRQHLRIVETQGTSLQTGRDATGRTCHRPGYGRNRGRKAEKAACRFERRRLWFARPIPGRHHQGHRHKTQSFGVITDGKISQVLPGLRKPPGNGQSLLEKSVAINVRICPPAAR